MDGGVEKQSINPKLKGTIRKHQTSVMIDGNWQVVLPRITPKSSFFFALESPTLMTLLFCGAGPFGSEVGGAF